MKNDKCWYKEACTQQCSTSCIRYLEMQYLIENSGIPLIMQYPKLLFPDDGDYDAFCTLADIKDDILDFVYSGQSLYITSSSTGNGKTSWAIKLLLKYFDEIWAGNGFKIRGVFVHVPTLILKLKNFENPLSESYKNCLIEADIVVWDDIASTDLTNYDLTQLLMYIDYRVLSGKANIYTGNIVSENQLTAVLGARLSSRIWKTSSVITLRGKDRRAS